MEKRLLRGIDLKITRSNKPDKKFKVNVNDKTIHFGAKGYSISPGTPKGDRYCARSYGITDKDGNPTRNDKESPNYWSRKMWKCDGKVSRR